MRLVRGGMQGLEVVLCAQSGFGWLRVAGGVDEQPGHGGKLVDCAGNRAAVEAKGERDGSGSSWVARGRRKRKGELLGSPSPARKPRG